MAYRSPTSFRSLLVLVFLFSQGCLSCDSSGDGTGAYGFYCKDDTWCRIGLTCHVATTGADGMCLPSGTARAGDSCQLTASCMTGLYCDATRRCATGGMGASHDSCAGTGDCMVGLACVPHGFYSRCEMYGMADLGAACTRTTDCLAGLTCAVTAHADGGVSGFCSSPPPVAPVPDGGVGDGSVPFTPPALPPWSGETCTTDTGPARAYFDVPRTGVAGDFYRLPFPNDVRRTATGLSLSGHPHPGTVLSVDVMDLYLRASETDLDGFSTNPVVFFRFSKPYDWASVGGALEIVDITAGSPTYNAPTSLAWLTEAGPITKYICENWLAMRAPHGAPLRPGTTYAAVMASTVVQNGGAPFARSPDLDALLAATAPTDTTLTAAYASYAPLRAWLADTHRDPSTVLNAAVFTTQHTEAVAPKLREVIRARPAPTVRDLTVCTAGAHSPCDDGTMIRACDTPDGRFTEVHGRISLPIFQAGTEPYEEPADGGGIMRDSAGVPLVARSEDVCFAMTIPTGTMPAAGWPLMIYAHGTGGSFTGAVRDGLAHDVADPALAGPAATLAIDLPEHGARRGASHRDPKELFYNFANPRAARDNIAQGAADLYSLVFFATRYMPTATEFPTGSAVQFDPTRIVLFAHSQGATHAALVAPYEPDLNAVLLSGEGGDLAQSLMTKTQPVDVSHLLPFALLDVDGTGGLAGGEWNPTLAIWQMYFDSVDPVNFAWRLNREPVMGDTGRNVFMTYGLGDTYSTEQTMQAFSLAAGLPLVRPLVSMDYGLPQLDAPVSANITFGTMTPTMRTQALRQYRPSAGMDGHFVSTDSGAGRADVLRFMTDALGGTAPRVGM